MEKQAQDVVFKAVARLNEMRDADSRLTAAPGTVIAGPEGQLDSMDLINLLLLIEEELAQAVGQHVDVMSKIGDRVASSASFTVNELTELVQQSVAELN